MAALSRDKGIVIEDVSSPFGKSREIAEEITGV